MGLSTGSGSSGIKKYVDIPGGAPNWNMWPTFTHQGKIDQAGTVAYQSVPLGTYAVGDYILVTVTSYWQGYAIAAFGGTGNSGTSGGANGWNVTGTNHSGVYIDHKIDYMPTAGQTYQVLDRGPTQPNSSSSFAGMYAPITFWKRMTDTVQTHLQCGTTSADSNCFLVTKVSNVNVMLPDQMATASTSEFSSNWSSGGSQVTPHTGIYLPYFNSLPYGYLWIDSWVGATNASPANVPTGFTEFSATGRAQTTYSSAVALRAYSRNTFTDLQGLRANYPGVAAGETHRGQGFVFQAGTTANLTDTFSIQGEQLLDRVELINDHATETRGYLVHSGGNITTGQISPKTSAVFSPVVLKDEAVQLMQLDSSSTNKFRVLGLGRPIK